MYGYPGMTRQRQAGMWEITYLLPDLSKAHYICFCKYGTESFIIECLAILISCKAFLQTLFVPHLNHTPSSNPWLMFASRLAQQEAHAEENLMTAYAFSWKCTVLCRGAWLNQALELPPTHRFVRK